MYATMPCKPLFMPTFAYTEHVERVILTNDPHAALAKSHNSELRSSPPIQISVTMPICV